MGVTEKLGKFVTDTSYDQLPYEAIAAAKERILDSLGAMLGGSQERATQILIRFVKEGGGVPEAGVIGEGFKTSLANAVFVNATSAHTLELEPGGDTAAEAFPIIPIGLNTAETFGLSGKAVLEGVILGWEVFAHLTRAAFGAHKRGFISFHAPGPMAYAAQVSKMMKLSREQTIMAIGLAASQCGGLGQNGTMCHLLEGGFGARNGVTAALLAKDGMTAQADIIEGTRGYLRVFCGDDFDAELLEKDLGDPFFLAYPGVSIKKYGCCFGEQSSIEALLQLMEENNLGYDEVDKVEVEVHPLMLRGARFHDPQNGDQAKFSFPQALGAALLDGKVDFQTFSDVAAQDPRYEQARKKIDVIARADSEYHLYKNVRSTPPVKVRLKDGRTYSRTLELLKGSRELPLSREEFISRYATSIRGRLSKQEIQRSIDLVSDLENMPDIRELMELVTFCRNKGAGDA